MSLSLIGIIFVQSYYIRNAVKNEEERFIYNVKKALNYVSNTIEREEIDFYFGEYQRLLEEKETPDSLDISNIFVYQKNTDTKETIIYKSGILEEVFKLPHTTFDAYTDSISVKRITENTETRIFTGSSFSDIELNKEPELILYKTGRLTDAEKISFDKAFRIASGRVPVHKRVSKEEVWAMLDRKLIEDSIDVDFEFAIYNKDSITQVHSDMFRFNSKTTLGVPIFYNENNKTDYKLYLDFPGRKEHILWSISGIIFLSIIFTLVIIITYSSALYQLLKQRKISEIKSDFINNMTHEFKTPIATINLALDTIKNPKIIQDKDMVVRYLNMIKEENKRMHTQVENVLRILRLEKNELSITKNNLNLHDIINKAINHVALMIENKQGNIKSALSASVDKVSGNEDHLINVVVNILDNAIKYSSDAPEIEVSTENKGNSIQVKIKDKGVGISKVAQKQIFEKFYREHTGNIHDVKGHGLGLAYVKKIVEDHRGQIIVKSEKEKGSTFIISLPLKN